MNDHPQPYLSDTVFTGTRTKDDAAARRHLERVRKAMEKRGVKEPADLPFFIGLLNGLPLALCMWALIAAAFAFSMGWLKP